LVSRLTSASVARLPSRISSLAKDRMLHFATHGALAGTPGRRWLRATDQRTTFGTITGIYSGSGMSLRPMGLYEIGFSALNLLPVNERAAS
jgi:hypothetical protein